MTEFTLVMDDPAEEARMEREIAAGQEVKMETYGGGWLTLAGQRYRFENGAQWAALMTEHRS